MDFLKSPEFWKRKGFVSTALLPLAFLYRKIGEQRLKRVVPVKVDIPVICVGNVTVGGTGKTPTVLWLLDHFQSRDIEAHVMLRGYGGQVTSSRKVTLDDTVQTVGDEALLYRDHAMTWVGGDRVASARLAQDAGAQILLMDDGFQNPGLHKDLALLLVDGSVGLANGRCLPAGPLRESFEAACGRADLLILMQSNKIDSHSLAPDGLPVVKGFVDVTEDDKAWLQGRKVLGFSGIGRPEKFFDSLRSAGADIVGTISFGDHHIFSETELKNLENEANSLSACLVTTTKDFQRLDDAWKQKVKALVARPDFHDAESLIEKLDALI